MKLIYTATGEEVQIGDQIAGEGSFFVQVAEIIEPHKPESTGRVYVKSGTGYPRGFYPSVFGMEWAGRTDQD